MRRLESWLLLGGALFFTPDLSRAAGTTEACIESHGRSQESRAEGKLLESRARLLQCSKEECPGLIRDDCARWFEELEILVPSVAVVVRRGGIDLPSAEILFDGQPVEPGKEQNVDPGEHEVRVVAPGEEPLRRVVVLSPGDRHRLVVVELPVIESTKSARLPDAVAPPTPTHRPVQTVTWILGGAAVAFAATGGVFGVLALEERSSLASPPREGGCAPNCTDAQLGALNGYTLTSDILFGAAILSAAGAVLSYALRPEVPLEPAPESALRWGVGPGGAFVGYGGRF